MKVKIECEGASTIDLDELANFQGELKTLSTEDEKKLRDVILRYGFSAPILAWKNGSGAHILDGHQRIKVLTKLRDEGYEVPPLPVDWIKARSKKEAKQKLLTIASSYGKASRTGLEAFLLAADIELIDVLPEIRLPDMTPIKPPTRPNADDVPEILGAVVSATGDIWTLGEHRLMCGESTNETDVQELVAGEKVDAFLTDPPYCSGGFQESGKVGGSVGETRIGPDGKKYNPKVKNDTLSTRGYSALLREVHNIWNPEFSYVFTDWRMWTYLFDVLESCGLVVRSMVVWDKGSAGLGKGWRPQHELIMFGTSSGVTRFDNRKSIGNVLSVNRTGNPLHPTQKPVDVLTSILHVTEFCKVIADPFCGSGSTLIACEELERRCLAMESDPAFCDVTVKRYREWCEANGRTAVVKRNGKAA